ncbi:MAG: hypothetical protein GY758_04855 [Fuerstiella sp.]|nr:hypothetical protein [Fuerstiella sp.]MCP4505666.1 hypothetical protein [Fuerstiella sp.]
MKHWIAALIVLSMLHSPSESSGEEGSLRVTTFSVDITPPLGEPVGLGFIPLLTTAEHPLLARGILLRDAGLSCVICTLDWMEVHNESYDFLRQQLGNAAGVPASHVAVHCLHQHTAPAISTAAQRLQLQPGDPRRIASAEYLLSVSRKITAAIHTSQSHWRDVTHIGVGKAEVRQVASNRRIEQSDGSIRGRGSNTASSPLLRDLPEGLIDPLVRTVSLENTSGAVAQMHYYASHPQSFYGDGRASYDVPGIIRERLEHRSQVFQLYITGCGGDVAFGKYNDGTRTTRSQLTARLQAGIESSIENLLRYPVEPMNWSTENIQFPRRNDEEFTEARNRRILRDARSTESQRRKAAICLAWLERCDADRPVELSCLSVGRVQMLHLPGEPFVQYQLAAQQMQSDRFVCVAGYGDCGMGYIGDDRIFTDRGGYEQTYSFAGPCQNLFTDAIRKLLAGSARSRTEND